MQIRGPSVVSRRGDSCGSGLGIAGSPAPENRAAIAIPENWNGVLRRVLRSMDEASLRVLELARCSPLPLIRSETIGPQSAAPMPEG